MANDYSQGDEVTPQMSGSWWDSQPQPNTGVAGGGYGSGLPMTPMPDVPSGNGPLAPGQVGGFGQAPAAYVPASSNAPTYAAPTLAATEKFIAPTAEEAANAPGTQFGLQQAQLGSERSAAAKGSVLSGGFQKELGNYLQNVAQGFYGNTFGQKLAGNQSNNQNTLATNQQNLAAAQNQYANQFQNWNAQNQLGQTAYGINYNTSHAAANDYYQALQDQQKLGQQAGTQAVST